MITTTPLRTVLTGRAVPYTRPGSMSGIAKSAVAGPVQVTATGLAGDEQGDLRVHGGIDKAIHHYPYDHYPHWQAELDSPLLAGPGAFGENFSTLGWTEDTVHFGDVISVGTALLEVSQGRQPCWKLNDRFGVPRMAASVQSTGRTGWYYRVRQTGVIAVGDTMTVVERPYPGWPLSRLMALLFQRTLDRPTLEAASGLPLPDSWRKLIRHRLESRQVESWERRLVGPPSVSG
jgi:MOSC domain-containing protein YiiM